MNAYSTEHFDFVLYVRNKILKIIKTLSHAGQHVGWSLNARMHISYVCTSSFFIILNNKRGAYSYTQSFYTFLCFLVAIISARANSEESFKLN